MAGIAARTGNPSSVNTLIATAQWGPMGGSYSYAERPPCDSPREARTIAEYVFEVKVVALVSVRASEDSLPRRPFPQSSFTKHRRSQRANDDDAALGSNATVTRSPCLEGPPMLSLDQPERSRAATALTFHTQTPRAGHVRFSSLLA